MFVTFVFTLLLTAVVACILRMMLRRDILKYEQLPTFHDFDKIDDMGWKQVSREVFRPPQHAMLLSIFIGNGGQ